MAPRIVRLLIVPLFAAALALAACGRKPDTPPYPGFTDDGVAAAKRASQGLEASVLQGPKLRACWAELKGEGAVSFDLNYRKSGDKWMFEGLKPGKVSTLAPEQSAAAQRCLNDAARGTSFAADLNDGLEAAAPEFVLRLNWPVPLPPEGGQLDEQQMARMIGGGAAGTPTISGCSDCVSNPNPPYGLKCAAKKSGSQTDCEEINSNTCATTPKACLRGVFSGKGGIVMF